MLITGCSSGFGLHAAVEAAARGWRVFATVRRPGSGATVEAAALACRAQVEVVTLDVTSDGSVSAGVDQVLARSGGRLDAVVHNAGVAHGGFFEDQADGDVRAVFETNFFGVLRVSRATLPALRASGGRMVVMSSVSAYSGNPGLSAYVASKWALEGWAESIATELRPFGVQVAVVEPGLYRTAIVDNAQVAQRPGSPYAPWVDRYQAKVAAMAKRSGGDPAEVGRLVADLLDRRRLALRYPVGRGARTGRVLVRTLPFGVRAAATARWAGLPPARRGSSLLRPGHGSPP